MLTDITGVTKCILQKTVYYKVYVYITYYSLCYCNMLFELWESLPFKGEKRICFYYSNYF